MNKTAMVFLNCMGEKSAFRIYASSKYPLRCGFENLPRPTPAEKHMDTESSLSYQKDNIFFDLKLFYTSVSIQSRHGGIVQNQGIQKIIGACG
jgi:hypothetical protein